MLSAGPFVFLKNLNCFCSLLILFYVLLKQIEICREVERGGTKFDVLVTMISQSDLIIFYNALKLLKSTQK